MFTLLIAGWMNGKGLDGINRRLDDIVARLGRIGDDIKKHGEKIAMLDECTSPLARTR